MIPCNKFYNFLQLNNFIFFTGVPDSTLKNLCAYITDNSDKESNIIAANEGNAVGIASGYYLATGDIPVVYFQNSGLGNIINPLTSLASSKVYSMPILFLIGWRGEPEIKDEPQHVEMGAVQNPLLEQLHVPYKILPVDFEESKKFVLKAIDYLKQNDSPFALVIRKNTFKKYALNYQPENKFTLLREDVLKIILDNTSNSDIIISTTGKTSRELFELRKQNKQGHEKDFLTVGSMGHSSSIALGIALQKKNKRVICIDGDGALIMHMGALAVIGQMQPKNYIHIVINNFSHESVGGQPTASPAINIPALAKSCGYNHVFSAETEQKFKNVFQLIKNKKGPILIEVKCKIGSREDLGRPTIAPAENKNNFMRFLKNSE